MKKLLVLVVFVALFLVGYTPVNAEFVHPLDFSGTYSEKQEVIEYIKKEVKETYSKIGMDNPSTLRMMERENLDCFKKLTKVTNRQLLDRVIETYCEIGMCNYNTILMMYEEELKSSKESLKW